METAELKVFKIPVEDYVIVFIPQLAKVYKTDSKTAKKIADFVTVKKEKALIENKDVFHRCTLILTNACNLHCAYCYGDYGTPLKNKVMGWEIAKAAMDYTFKKAEREPVSLNFFGGEATLEWDLLKAGADYFRRLGLKQKKKTSLGITTNGYFAPYKADWLALNMDNILLSFDGFEEIQNKQRSDSFATVFENAKKIYEKAPAKLQFRITISAESVEQLSEIVTFFGKNFRGCTQNYEPLFETGRGKSKSLNSPTSALFFDKFIEALPSAKKYGSKIVTSVLRIKPQSVAFCGAAETNFMVTWEGKVVACGRRAEATKEGDNFFEYGYFDEKKKVFVFDKAKQEQLKTLRTENIKECSDCYASFNCKGDCPAEKAEIDAQKFMENPSYRCEEIQRFTLNILKLAVNGGYKNIF